jgi:hypothetical protein
VPAAAFSATLTVAIRDAEKYDAMAVVPNTERAFRATGIISKPGAAPRI